MVSGFDVSNWECVWHVLTGIGAFSTWTTVTICIWGHHTYSIARSTTGKLPEGYSLRPLRVRTRGECFKVNTLTRFSCATDRKIGVGVVDNPIFSTIIIIVGVSPRPCLLDTCAPSHWPSAPNTESPKELTMNGDFRWILSLGNSICGVAILTLPHCFTRVSKFIHVYCKRFLIYIISFITVWRCTRLITTFG